MDFDSFWSQHGPLVLIVMGILILIILIVSSVSMAYVLPLMYAVPAVTINPPAMTNRNRNKARYSGQNASVYDMQAAALTEGGSIYSKNCRSDDPTSSSSVLWESLNSSLAPGSITDTFLTSSTSTPTYNEATGLYTYNYTPGTVADDPNYVASPDLASWQSLTTASTSPVASGIANGSSASFTNRRRR